MTFVKFLGRISARWNRPRVVRAISNEARFSPWILYSR